MKICNADLLREVIALRGMSQTDLANAIDPTVSPQYISQLVNGHRRSASNVTASQIEMILRVSHGTIFRDPPTGRRRIRKPQSQPSP